jgi:hypothetical protein
MSPTNTLLALTLCLGLCIAYTGNRNKLRSGMKAWLRFKAKRQANSPQAFYDAFSNRRRAYGVPVYGGTERRRVAG